MKRLRVLMLAFQCKTDGASESYSSFKWVEQAARFHEVTLLTVDEPQVPGGVQLVRPSRRFGVKNKVFRHLNGEVKLDYFVFNRASRRQFQATLAHYDLVHLVAPLAPRYPCSLGVKAKRFILGPVGGGQRVPPAFRREVEGGEPWYFKLRLLDRWRLRHDPFLRRTYDRADLILLIGAYMWQLLPDEYHAKCELMLETGIDCDRMSWTPLTGRADGRRLKLLYVGRVVPYKGLIYALHALARLPAEVKGRFQLLVIGDRGEGRYEQMCKEFVGVNGLAEVVRFAGFKPKREIVRFYEECDLFVFPSLAETSGNVVLEAMAMGRPALVANCGGPAEVVTPASGFLVPPVNPEAFVERIKEVLVEVARDPKQLIGKGLEARRHMETKFDWNRKGEQLAAYYERVLALPRPFTAEGRPLGAWRRP